ncbi:TerB family tellurite resistance protein [Riemerella anatipestifer]|uniref:TerB family tellurite resistance protein n=1 Tax=Riemerella anatipestifer TaxID=34085 RepID=UPI002A8564C2|nr:TerB family tellurite resistance protein [Riemerella anatipestifer]MDY3324720.1 TerB family tellurite resistance protein [Riemerella anatipestifer]MDY3350829.1 TerB family tellurite resistance protein [Riemerella anatipestifer]MDY3353530.1 TerB family tellurite resistance protein [Riemerella anatipestifer]MDY3538208.1 TerB family tellurite resistance protein [Riemerella anatipestifer]
MQKSNKSIAGYHLLMILSAVDYEVQPEEGIVIQKYLADEFPFRINLDNELEVIATLQPEEWKDHFEFHARCFLDDSTEAERKNFAKFAKTLIKADNEVTEREHQFYKLMKTIWKLD